MTNLCSSVANTEGGEAQSVNNLRSSAANPEGEEAQSVTNLCSSVANSEGGEAHSVTNLCSSAAKKPRRGGRRPGAGAPPGNLNALKHGRRSAQFAQLGALLASSPQAREALLGLARRHRLKQRRAEQVAALLLQRLIQRARQIQEGRLNDQPPIDERRTIERTVSGPRDAEYDGRARSAELTPAQSNPEPGDTPTIDPQIGKTV